MARRFLVIGRLTGSRPTDFEQHVSTNVLNYFYGRAKLTRPIIRSKYKTEALTAPPFPLYAAVI